MLTDEQCDEFKLIPGSYNDMIIAIYESGFSAGKAKAEKDAIDAQTLAMIEILNQE